MASRASPATIMSLDANDQFRASCNGFKSYPSNLLRTRHSASALQTLAEELTKREGKLFDDEDALLEILDLYDGTRAQVFQVNGILQLRGRLQQNRKDPWLRYISIEAESSRDSLFCSSEMFKYLCSFHQIPPSMLDVMFSFGKTLRPLDFGLATFCQEDTLLVRDRQRLSLPSLGRSGREIRHSYLLRSLEPSSSVPSWPWGIRQVGVYHSFDVVTGRSTWVTVKGNELIRDRVNEAVASNQDIQNGPQQSLADSFSATLDIHLVILDWTDESTRWCINRIEDDLRGILLKAKRAKIDSDPHFSDIPEDIKQSVFRAGTTNSKVASRSNTLVNSIYSGLERAQTFAKRASFGRGAPVTSILPIAEKTASQAASSRPANPAEKVLAPVQDTKSRMDSLVILDMFSFQEMQTLQGVAERVQEALLMVRLNAKVLGQIREYYTNIKDTDAVPELSSIQKDCRNDLLMFLSRVKDIEANLATRAEQLESLLQLVRDGKTLYDGILQYRSVQISRIYAESAHASSRKMEKIAHKTEEETISMHIITFVTLVFLPGTFIAVRSLAPLRGKVGRPLTTSHEQTFLQSGIFQWNTLKEGEGGTWFFKKDAFALFAGICLVLMTVTFMLWLFLFKCLRARARRKLHERLENGEQSMA